MSSWVLAWAWTRHGLSDGAHLLLCYLSDPADDDGVVGLVRAMSRPSLAALFDCSEKTIDRRVNELVADKAMEVEHRSRPAPQGGVVSITNVYRLASPPRPERVRKHAPHQGDKTVALVAPADPAPVTIQGDTSGNQGDISSPARTDLTGGVGTPVVAPVESRARAGAPGLPPLPVSLRVGDDDIPRLTTSRKADWLLHAVNSPLLDPSKAAALISGAFEVERWVQAGADLELVVLPVFLAEIQKRKAANRGHISSWGLLRNDVREAAARFLAPNEPILPLESRDGERVAFTAKNDQRGMAERASAGGGGSGAMVGAAERALKRRQHG